MNSNAKLKEFWGESSHFADLFNTVFFGGRAVILPETLSETDTALTAAVKRKKRKGFSVEKFRDVFMTWRGHGLAVLGIENQTKADYVLPERLLLYDALGYEVQRRRIARKHRREKSLKAPGVCPILWKFRRNWSPTLTTIKFIYFPSIPAAVQNSRIRRYEKF